jgi:hypothetical protein
MAIASVLNALTSTTSMDSAMRLGSTKGEVVVRHRLFDPRQLRDIFSPLCTRLEAAKRSPDHTPPTDAVTQLDRLSKLRESGALSEAEFQAAKAPLIKQLTEGN